MGCPFLFPVLFRPGARTRPRLSQLRSQLARKSNCQTRDKGGWKRGLFSCFLDKLSKNKK